MNRTYLRHPLSAAFPSMETEAFEELKADIRKHGVKEKIVLYEGMIMDGWHRYVALCQLQMPLPPMLDFEGNDPVATVMSKNLHRRNMDNAQRAYSIALLSEWQKGKPVPPAPRESAASVAVAVAEKPMSRKAAAVLAGVDEKTMTRARTVVKLGTPEVKQAVVDGKMGVTEAARISKLPPEVQLAAVEQSKDSKWVKGTNKSGKPRVLKLEYDELLGRYDALVVEYEAVSKELKRYKDAESTDTQAKQIMELHARVDSLIWARNDWQRKHSRLNYELKTLKEKAKKGKGILAIPNGAGKSV